MDSLSRNTGGQVDEIVNALVNAAHDKDANVRRDIMRSLCELGKKQPLLVLSICSCYLNKHQKLKQGHRIVLLDTMAHIVNNATIAKDVDLLKELIHLASAELTKTRDIEPEWQTAASKLLVALGSKASDDVMAELLQQLVPGVLPHYFVVLTLANLATENVFAVVPFLKDIFSRMLAMLGMAKQDNMKWVFAHCIGRFSEAILDYCANIENAPYPDITKDRFCGEIYSAYEIMFNVWMPSKESKLRLAVVEALGHMAQLISSDKLEEQAQKLIQGITGLYRKHSEHYLITESLCMVIDAACSEGSQTPLPFLDQLLNGIYGHACVEPDFSNAQLVKNYNEILRCFQVLTKAFPDRVMNFLLHKLESGNERGKMATLGILRHIIYSADQCLVNKKEILLSGLTSTLQESSIKLRKALAQVIIAMAHHGYLQLEGGERMVEFIVRQCSLSTEQTVTSPGRKAAADDNPSGLKTLCDNILHLFTTTIEDMESVLWPFLFQTLIPEQYTNGMLAVCRSLTHLARKKRQEEDSDYQIDFVSEVNVPKPHSILARLFVLAGYPSRGGNRGVQILSLMQAIAPIIHESITDMWDTVIPKLTQYLEETPPSSGEWNQKTWEDLILKLLSKTLSEIENEEYNLGFGRILGQQINLYSRLPEEKSFLYKCLGIVLRKAGTSDFIREHLNLIFSSVDHTSQIEREGCAIGIGFCAASHLDKCLVKLEEITKTEMIRKSTGFMGLTKDKTEADVERIKCTVAICYGYVVLYAPPGLVISRLETNVLRVLNPYLSSAKDEKVKENLIKAVSLFGKAVQQSCRTGEFVFSKKSELLKYIEVFDKIRSKKGDWLSGYLLKEPKTQIGEIRILSIEAITSLIKAVPVLDEKEMQNAVNVCSDSIYPVLELCEKFPHSGDSESSRSQLVKSINSLMEELISRDCTSSKLQGILQLLERFLVSIHDHERAGVIQTLKAILNTYLQTMSPESGTHFNCLGWILGRILPRCTDPVQSVRKDSMECLQLLLTINDRYEGVPVDVNDERIESISKLKENLESSDASLLFNVINELGMVICKKTPDEQLNSLVYSLLDGLNDKQSQSSNGACVTLNCIMKHRGAELGSEINKLISEIHNKLLTVAFPATITGTIVAIRTLASHHLILVLTAILGFPLPLSQITKEFWQTLAKDRDLTQDTFDHLLDLLSRSSPYTEKEDPRDKRPATKYATLTPMAANCALTEIFRVPETEELVGIHFSRLFAAIVLRMGSCVGVKLPLLDSKSKRKENHPLPMSIAIECFKEYLSKSCLKISTHVEEENGWALLEDEKTFVDGLEIVARALCENVPKNVNDIVSCLLQSLQSSYDTQRVAATAIFAELINQRCCGDMQLVELLMNSLLSKLVDPAHLVRRLCIKGLGNVASAGGHKLHVYSTTILSAMMAGMDDKEDPENCITLEAMSGLSRILLELEESSVRQILINICLRIRPCFEKDKKEVRAAAIELFGNLSRFGTGPSENSFLEQIHTNFVSVLLHLNEEPEVNKACKVALRQLGPRLGSSSIDEMFQKHLIDGGHLHYGEFTNNLSRLIIADFPEKINFYVISCVSFLKSSWPDIRANSATLVGFLLGNLSDAMRENVSKEHVCSALVMLLKDTSPAVRSKAAEAMSLLSEY